jgi:L-lactate dehydrogenase complex protein LldG
VTASPAKLFTQFQEELWALRADGWRFASPEQAQAHLRSLAFQFQWHLMGYRESPAVLSVVEGFPPTQVRRVDETWTPQQIAALDAAVIPGELFLADTGTALLLCRQRWERLLSYLPPACVIVGYLDRLYANMAVAWSAVAAWAADPEIRGEFVWVTGPSRTSDIEKVLTLGVHGPKHIVVFLLE